MSDRKPLMPKATAVWLVENTSLTFEQIAEFCGLHVLEVKGIADGDVAQGIKGMDPVTSGQLTREEIARAEEDHDHSLTIAPAKVEIARTTAKKRGPRYTPVSRRHDRPNAVLWLLKNHPELKDSQIMRLVGTTKPTIAQIRDRTHWNSAHLAPQDPVALGLCTQIDLDAEVGKAAKRVPADPSLGAQGGPRADTLLPTAMTTDAKAPEPAPAPAEEPGETPREEEARILKKLKGMSSGDAGKGEEDAKKPE